MPHVFLQGLDVITSDNANTSKDLMDTQKDLDSLIEKYSVNNHI